MCIHLIFKDDNHELETTKKGMNMKRRKGIKKEIRQELIGKSEDYKCGYTWAEEYFEHRVKGGGRIGGAVFRSFVEVVAESIKNKEHIGEERRKSIDYLIRYHDSEFHRGVVDLLLKKIDEYNGGSPEKKYKCQHCGELKVCETGLCPKCYRFPKV